MSTVKQFTVKRSSWVRGDMQGSALLKKNGRKCCLGFLGQACGIPNIEMLGAGVPSDVGYVGEDGSWEFDKRWPQALFDSSNFRSNERHLACDNDEESISDKQREKQLKTKFKTIGIKINFVD